MSAHTTPTKLTLVESRRKQRAQLHQILNSLPNIEIIEDVFDRQTAVFPTDTPSPDIWLLSLSLPAADCVATVRQIKIDDGHAKILLLTPPDPPHDILLRAIDAGALGYVDEAATAEELQIAIETVVQERPYLPPESTYQILQKASNELEVSSSERRDQLTQMLFIFIPIGAGLTALLNYVEGEFWERLDINPQYLGINASDRLAVLVTNILLLIGIFGPLLFTTLWLTPIRNVLTDKYAAKAEHRPGLRLLLKLVNGRIGTLLFAGIILASSLFIARFAPLVSIMFIGTAVLAILIINTLGLEEYIPKQLDLPRYEPWRVFLFFSAVVAIFAFVLGYELLFVGPQMRPDGVDNPTLAFFLDIEAFPVTVIDINGEASDYDALLLGGAAGVHVLHNPCNNTSFYVPTERVFFRATKEVDCAKATTP